MMKFSCEVEKTLDHLAFVIEHRGLMPDNEFGGCSCETCETLRDRIAAAHCAGRHLNERPVELVRGADARTGEAA